MFGVVPRRTHAVAGSLIEAKQRVKIPVMAMDRPRPAGFCYSPVEFAVMERDADLLLQHGADGIVFGVLNADGTVDTRRSSMIRSRIGSRQAVFHRAFDVAPDPFRALEELIDLGITRVLTSGRRTGAPEGSALIRQLIERAAGRIEVLPGAGIGLDNVRDLIAATGMHPDSHDGVFGAPGDLDAVESADQVRRSVQPVGICVPT